VLSRFTSKRRRVEPSGPAPERRIVLARRGDGLGERLNALLNAMRLAKILGVDYRFTWPLGRPARDPHHAIVPAREFFSADFLAAHEVGHRETRGAFELLPGPAMDLESVQALMAASDRGILAPSHPLSEKIDPSKVPAVTGGFAKEFEAIGFHPSIEAAIAQARAVPIGEGSVGIHLRGGDNLYGKYRTWTRYWYKAIPVPIARKLVEWSRSTHADVLIFGQHPTLIADLCSSTGAIEAATLRPPGLSAAEEAMFDLVLLSRCSRIISGWSGFAIQAATISDKKVEHHFDLITPDVAVALTREDIAKNGERYDPVQRAFAWWAAYYVARHELSHRESVELVEKALAADPTNPRSRLRLAALHYRNHDIDRGDDVLIDALHADAATGGSTLESVMLFSVMTLSGTLDSAEIVDDFERGASDGPGPASIYRAAIRARRGDIDGANTDLADFRAFVASDAVMSDLDDEVVQATIYQRILHAGRVD
jgi:hypothetical protein